MGLGSGIRDPGFGKNLFQIPEDPARIPDPGSGSATLYCSMHSMYVQSTYVYTEFCNKKSCQSIQ
jgi:hypothetical protein